jgi:hypothetical protein
VYSLTDDRCGAWIDGAVYRRLVFIWVTRETRHLATDTFTGCAGKVSLGTQ